MPSNGIFSYLPEFGTGTFEFTPSFTEYMPLYKGIIHVWIGNGAEGEGNTGDAGVLYAQYADLRTQEIGPVSSYAIAVANGYTGTEEDWADHITYITQHATDAEAWAVGMRDGIAVGQNDITYENNAQYYSELAGDYAEHAEQAAANAGYMDFHIDENDHLIYEFTENINVDFELEEGRLIAIWPGQAVQA